MTNTKPKQNCSRPTDLESVRCLAEFSPLQCVASLFTIEPHTLRALSVVSPSFQRASARPSSFRFERKGCFHKLVFVWVVHTVRILSSVTSSSIETTISSILEENSKNREDWLLIKVLSLKDYDDDDVFTFLWRCLSVDFFYV